MKLIYTLACLISIRITLATTNEQKQSDIKNQTMYSENYSLFQRIRETVQTDLPNVLDIARNAIIQEITRITGKYADPNKICLHYFGNTVRIESPFFYAGWEHVSPPIWSVTLTGTLLERINTDLTSEELNMQYGIYKCDDQHRKYGSDNEIRMYPHELYAAIKKIDFTAQLSELLDGFWVKHYDNWCALAKIEFIRAARLAKTNGVLSEVDYKELLQGMSNVPLEGPITFSHLNTAFDTKINAFFLDINGLLSTDILYFRTPSFRYILYIPSNAFDYDIFLRNPHEIMNLQNFHVFSHYKELHEWIVENSRSPAGQLRLLSHFALIDRGSSSSKVEGALKKIAKEEWDHTSIVNIAPNKTRMILREDPFRRMVQRVSERSYNDIRTANAKGYEPLSPFFHMNHMTLLAKPMIAITGPIGVPFTIEPFFSAMQLKIPRHYKIQKCLENAEKEYREDELIKLFGAKLE